MAKSIFKYTKSGNCLFSCKLMSDISKININKDHFFLTKPLFQSYKDLLKRYPHNNILHNEIKKIIIKALKAKQSECLGEVI